MPPTIEGRAVGTPLAQEFTLISGTSSADARSAPVQPVARNWARSQRPKEGTLLSAVAPGPPPTRGIGRGRGVPSAP
jgi:hypothetical protein